MVCINQADIEEKGHQVKQMGRVYSNATRVLIWLGPDLEEKAQDFSKVLEHMNLTDEHYHPVEPSFMGYLKEILRFSWFSRMWVLQEFWLARRALMLWGHTELDASSVQSWASHMAADRGAKHITWFSLLSASIPTNVQFLSTLQATRSLLCADDRDRIYALLGLPYDSDFPLSKALLGIEPD
jgi:hypothetical protein